MNTVEATCRGDPGAVFLSSTVRSAIYATQVLVYKAISGKIDTSIMQPYIQKIIKIQKRFQGKNIPTRTSILESLHTFEKDRRHIHRVFWTDREGTTPDKVKLLTYSEVLNSSFLNKNDCSSIMKADNFRFFNIKCDFRLNTILLWIMALIQIVHLV